MMRGLIERIADRVPTPVRRADRRAWAEARTLPELGDLTARWLEGDLWSQPAYQPNCGPDEETRDLVPTLAAVNRAGFVTGGSQPGLSESGAGAGGGHLRQRAAVYGFADQATAALLCDTAVRAGLRATSGMAGTWRSDYTSAVPVTTVDGEVFTGFGARLSRRKIQELYEGLCSDEAISALRRAWQVTIVDLNWGRNCMLWPALEHFARDLAPHNSKETS